MANEKLTDDPAIPAEDELDIEDAIEDITNALAGFIDRDDAADMLDAIITGHVRHVTYTGGSYG